jgi:hypothetical protein
VREQVAVVLRQQQVFQVEMVGMEFQQVLVVYVLQQVHKQTLAVMVEQA